METPVLHIQIQRTISDGNYGSVTASVMASHVPVGASEKQIEEILRGADNIMQKASEYVNNELSHQLGIQVSRRGVPKIEPPGANGVLADAPPKVPPIFGHTIEAEFPKSVNWRSPMTPGLKTSLQTEWKRFGLTMTQVDACEKAILKEAGEEVPDTGLLAGQAWIITKFLKETQSKRDPVNAMLIAADVSELEKPIEGEELAKEAADIFA